MLLGWVTTGFTRAALARDRARTAWEARDAGLAVRAAAERARAGLPGPALAPVEGSPVARLYIPRLGLDEVVVEGVDAAALEAGPGHMPRTPLPGAPGNAVVSAHRDRHFRRLDQVVVGDTVITESDAGRVTWVIASRKVVPRDARVIRGADRPTLTLTTCWPVRYFGPAPDRLILAALPVSGTDVTRSAARPVLRPAPSSRALLAAR